MRNLTPQSIKKNNYTLIYNLIYKSEKIAKQDIAAILHLSLPTVTQNLVRLEEEGLIEKTGQFDSAVGRKAAAYSLCKNARLSIGVEILKSHIHVLAVNLFGEIKKKIKLDYTFENTNAYYNQVCQEISQFINDLGMPDTHILGIGFAMQGLISPDGSEIIYGKILGCTGLHISVFSQALPWPCQFMHDAECAAISELWMNHHLTSAVYLSLGKHLGAAIIIDGQILPGKHGHSATIEHMTVDPGGTVCYCGKRGCLETQCSLNALLDHDETIDTFFDHLRSGHPDQQQRWRIWMENLAAAINNLHLIIDTDYILGGHIAPYLIDDDIQLLHDIIREKTAFKEPEDFIHVSQLPRHNVPIGAAIPYIKNYLRLE